jgi:hypothetical protein
MKTLIALILLTATAHAQMGISGSLGMSKSEFTGALDVYSQTAYAPVDAGAGLGYRIFSRDGVKGDNQSVYGASGFVRLRTGAEHGTIYPYLKGVGVLGFTSDLKFGYSGGAELGIVEAEATAVSFGVREEYTIGHWLTFGQFSIEF